MISIENFEMELLTMCKRILPMHKIDTLDTHKGRGLYFREINFNNDVKAFPVFHFADLYEEYQKAEDINEIINKILSLITSDKLKKFDIAMKEFEENIESVMDCIYPILINIELNQEILKRVKHINWTKHIALTYIIKRKDFTMRLTHDIFEVIKSRIEITDFDLNEKAFKNLYQERVLISNWDNVMIGMLNGLGIKELFKEYSNESKLLINELYTITLEENIIGASALLNYSILNEIAHNFNGDFVIIPSSTEELLIVKPNIIDKWILKDIEEMIKDININIVEEEIRLSNFPLIYSKEKKIIMDVEDYLLQK